MADVIPTTTSQGDPAPDSPEYKAQLTKMVKGSDEPKPEEPKPPATDEPKPEGEDDEPEGEEEEDGDEEGEDTEEEEGEKKPEDKYSKAFRQLQKERVSLQEFKASVLVKERDIQQRERQAQKNEAELASFVKALRVDPFATLLRAGILNEDDAEYVSKQLYYHSKTAATDPKNKAEADRLRREREQRLEFEEQRHKLARLEKEREDERTQAQQKQTLDAYTSKIEGAVEVQKSKHPLLAKAMEKNPARTRQELFKIANDLSYAKQAYADPGLVVLAWVKERKALMAEMGISEPVKKPPERDKSKPAAEKRGQPDGKSNGSTAQPGSFDEDAYYKELNARLKGEMA